MSYDLRWRVIRPSPQALQIFKTKEIVPTKIIISNIVNRPWHIFNRYNANTRLSIINPNIRKQRSTFWCLYIPHFADSRRFADSLDLRWSWHLVVKRFHYYLPTGALLRRRRRREASWRWRDPAQGETGISSTNSMITRIAGCVFICSKKAAGFVGRVDATAPGAFFLLVVGVLVVLVLLSTTTSTTCTPCCCCWCATTLFSSSESCPTFIGFVHKKKQMHSAELIKHLQLIHNKVIENNKRICFFVFAHTSRNLILNINNIAAIFRTREFVRRYDLKLSRKLPDRRSCPMVINDNWPFEWNQP